MFLTSEIWRSTPAQLFPAFENKVVLSKWIHTTFPFCSLRSRTIFLASMLTSQQIGRAHV